MRHWEKSKKDLRRQDEVRIIQDEQKKKKLKPVEKSKYRTKGYYGTEEEE